MLVTHDLDEAAQLASHLVLLDSGRRVQSGPLAKVLTRPASEIAARLLDIPNIFTGRREGDALQWGPHRLRLPTSAAAACTAAAGDCRFAILPQNVLLVRPDRPLGSHLDNLLDGRVREVMQLGTEALVWIEVAGLPGPPIQMRLPARALERYRVTAGSSVRLSLRTEDIVLLGA